MGLLFEVFVIVGRFIVVNLLFDFVVFQVVDLFHSVMSIVIHLSV